jgi:hypothetical protein
MSAKDFRRFGPPNEHPANMAIQADGTPMALTPAEVDAKVRELIFDGELIAVIARKDGQIGVHVFGDPSQEIIDILERAIVGYKRVLRGHA